MVDVSPRHGPTALGETLSRGCVSYHLDLGAQTSAFFVIRSDILTSASPFAYFHHSSELSFYTFYGSRWKPRSLPSHSPQPQIALHPHFSNLCNSFIITYDNLNIRLHILQRRCQLLLSPRQRLSAQSQQPSPSEFRKTN